MNYSITTQKDGLDIDVTEVAENREHLVQAFQACRQGRCSCPTREYEKVETFDVETSGESIRLSIRTRPGENISAAEIEKCLQHTSDRCSGD